MKFQYLVLALSFLSIGFLNAQDGKSLFESKCSVCHKIDKPSTGPALQGSKERWEKNSTVENFYAWVKNSKEVLESGDPYANQMYTEYKKANMPPQDLTNEQIDAIFEYVENPPAPEPEQTGTVSGVPVESKPDYELNQKIAFGLMALAGILIVAILIMTFSLKSILTSDYFKKRMKEKEEESSNGSNNSLTTIALLIIGSVLLPASTFAQDSGSSEYFMKVSTAELWMLGVFNLVLLGLFIYLGEHIKKILLGLKSEEALAEIQKQKEEQKTITQFLTDAVDVEDEASIVMDHEYDGIRELDNNLPPWWKWGFYVSIVFAIFYIVYYTFIGPSQLDEYNEEMRVGELAKAEYLKNAAMNVDENTATLLVEPEQIASGKAVFEQKCAACHKLDGSGENGPNLTDKNWIYGYDIKDVFKTISKGTPRGMEVWSKKLNPVQIQEVASYVLTLEMVPGGKAPEGDIIEPSEDEMNAATDSSSVVKNDTIVE